MIASIDWYEANSETVAARYEGARTDAVHGWLLDLLPKTQATILDVGAGSGRDAAWLAEQGHEVVAVEPSPNMQAAAKRLHPGDRIHWINDSLPTLTAVTRAGLSFDLILLSAVWMHVPAGDRPRAFRKLVNLLKPGGLIAITLRHGPAEPDRAIHPVSLTELEGLVRNHGAFIERSIEAGDQLGREDVRWTQVAIRLPDDGTGALPLLRHIILNDVKSSTYKLALLRTLCRVADGAPGFARDYDDDFVAVPLGLVALTWIRLFMPLLQSSFPQTSDNVGYERLGFVKDAFRKLTAVSSLDLRIGMAFTGDLATTLHRSLKDAAATITSMPAAFMTYSNGEPILHIRRGNRLTRPSRIVLNKVYLASFGEMLVPRHMWAALQRLDVWIEPALVTEWTRLIKNYAKGQGKQLNGQKLEAAMTWNPPTRDVSAAQRAVKLLEEGQLFCVWSGKRLVRQSMHIDHCFSWSTWPCGDLWNLMPADTRVNLKKGSRLPSDRLLREAGERILHWWGAGYIQNSSLSEQFWLEASASLPGLASQTNILPDIFDAVCLQRAKLRHDQQVPEWTG